MSRQCPTLDANKNLNKTLSIFKFWSVVIPMIFTWVFAHQISALVVLPRYHQECAKAFLLPDQGNQGQPCVCKTATATLKNNYTARGFLDSQHAELSFSDGSNTSMRIDHEPTLSPDNLSEAQVDGPWLVEIWHGKVTAITKTGYKLTSADNPDLQVGFFSWFLLLIIFALMLLTWFGYARISKSLSR